jgi:hypothetical protein
MLDTLAVRARLGESAADLKAFALSMVPGICAELSEDGLRRPRG